MKDIKAAVKVSEGNTDDIVQMKSEESIEEQNGRDARKMNVIVFGLEESISLTPLIRELNMIIMQSLMS